MRWERVVVTRQELYGKVWEKPLVEVAPQYGLSDVGLAKVCHALDIPTPPRGYWAKLQYGQEVHRVPLPPSTSGHEQTYVINERNVTKRERVPDDLRDTLIKDLRLGQPIRVPERMRNPHPLVQATSMALEHAEPTETGVLCIHPEKGIDIRVSPAQMRRALRVLDTIVKAMEERGFGIGIRSKWAQQPYFLVYGEEVEFRFEESLRRIEHVLTKYELQQKQRYGAVHTHKWDYVPTGLLALGIEGAAAEGYQKVWGDTQKKKIENRINEAVLGIVAVAGKAREYRLAREEEARRRHEEQIRIEEEQRRLRLEQERFAQLEKEAELWGRSRQLKEYIAEVRQGAAGVDADRLQVLLEWVDWATAYADQLDPVPRWLTLDAKLVWSVGTRTVVPTAPGPEV